MALSDQDLLDYIAAHPGAGREEIRRHTAPDASSPTVWRRPQAAAGGQQTRGLRQGPRHWLQPGRRCGGPCPILLSPITGVRRSITTRTSSIITCLAKVSISAPPNDSACGTLAHLPYHPCRPARMPSASSQSGFLSTCPGHRRGWKGTPIRCSQPSGSSGSVKRPPARTRKEAVMILNHKEAIQYVADNP